MASLSSWQISYSYKQRSMGEGTTCFLFFFQWDVQHFLIPPHMRTSLQSSARSFLLLCLIVVTSLQETSFLDVKTAGTKANTDGQDRTVHSKYRQRTRQQRKLLHLNQMKGKQIVIESSSLLLFSPKSLIHISLGNSLQMIYRICEIQL